MVGVVVREEPLFKPNEGYTFNRQFTIFLANIEGRSFWLSKDGNRILVRDAHHNFTMECKEIRQFMMANEMAEKVRLLL
jgi:hypothetical protein